MEIERSRTYGFQLAWSAIQRASETYLLTAEFQQTNGGRFYDQIVLEPPQGAYAAKGTTVPTTFISEEPATAPSSAPTAPPTSQPCRWTPKPDFARSRIELTADFDFSRPLRISRAPGRLDVMGGIADYTGSLVCELPLDRAAAVVLQERRDREFQVFSFNLFDEHRPFTFRIPLDSLAAIQPSDQLSRERAGPSRGVAGQDISAAASSFSTSKSSSICAIRKSTA